LLVKKLLGLLIAVECDASWSPFFPYVVFRLLFGLLFQTLPVRVRIKKTSARFEVVLSTCLWCLWDVPAKCGAVGIGILLPIHKSIDTD